MPQPTNAISLPVQAVSRMPTAAADNLPAAIASPLEKGVQTATVTVGHAFDLETGDSYAPAPDAVPWGPAGGEEWDFALFAFFMNGTHSNHANMYVNWADGETAAYLEAVPFDQVTAASLSEVTLRSDPPNFVQYHFEPDDTYLVKTDSGNTYKIGDLVVNANQTITFDYQWLA